jgi:hypothetical protein
MNYSGLKMKRRINMKKILDLWLYGANSDERERQLSAHAGYVSFAILMIVLSIRYVLEIFGLAILGSQWVDLAIVLLFSILHISVRSSLGVGVGKVKNQLLLYLIIGIGAAAISASVAYLQIRNSGEDLTFPILISALLGAFFSISISAIFQAMGNRAADKKNRAELGDDE